MLDLGLPKVRGLDVLRQVRADTAVPVIVLSGRSDEADRIIGLELGADDYVVKPFSPRELVARVRSVLRRSRSTSVVPSTLQFPELELDLTTARGVACAASTSSCVAASSTCSRSCARHRARCSRGSSCCATCGTPSPSGRASAP